MIARSTRSFDPDLQALLEDTFNIRIPAKYIADPLRIEAWLALHVSNQRPTAEAKELLRLLAEVQQRPELARDLDGSWRGEQVSALVRDISREYTTPKEQQEMFSQPVPQRFGEHSGSSDTPIRDSRKLLPTKSSMAIFTALLILILLYHQFLR